MERGQRRIDGLTAIDRAVARIRAAVEHTARARPQPSAWRIDDPEPTGVDPRFIAGYLAGLSLALNSLSDEGFAASDAAGARLGASPSGSRRQTDP